jgi:hypothetical protein
MISLGLRNCKERKNVKLGFEGVVLDWEMKDRNFGLSSP